VTTTSKSNKLVTKDPASRLLAWSADVAQARFVNATRAKLLTNLGITTIGDLLYHAPYRYLDLTNTAQLGPVQPGDATVVGTVHEVTKRSMRRPGRKQLTVTEVTLTDGTGTLIGVWFNQPWVEQSYRKGQVLAFSGDIKYRQGLKQIVQPFVEKIADAPVDAALTQGQTAGESVQSTESSHMGRVLPVHGTTEGLSVGWLRRIVAAAVDDFAQVSEYLPVAMRAAHDFPSYAWALHKLHFPESLEQAHLARQRLAYGELLDFQLLLARRRYALTREGSGHTHHEQGRARKALDENIPFELTTDQATAVSEILQDMAASKPMQRLLLGDVGTGKTIVAAYALAVAADSAGQAAMMAPTEVLAQQYAGKLGPLFDQIGVSWGLLTSATPANLRRDLLEDLALGKLSVLFGTHALLQPDVIFKRMTLAIVDEQHRFGVEQRKALHDKGWTDGCSADVLVMSATPIPRTLTLTAFGDLAASYLRERPIAGAGVSTQKVKFSAIDKPYDAVHQAVAAGRQAYIVCALIDESSQAEAVPALRLADMLSMGEFADYRVELLTGRMKSTEKAAIMDRFRAGKIDVLISTTVIEVGVDVHNATVMVILDADRYGLAQLHQLRGRVGRGQHHGEVWLVSDSFAQTAKERFEALLATTDGFKLAELDLKQRGAGELMGTRQSGLANFKIADLSRDEDLIDAARQDAFALISDNPQLESDELALLRLRVEALETQFESWKVGG